MAGKVKYIHCEQSIPNTTSTNNTNTTISTTNNNNNHTITSRLIPTNMLDNLDRSSDDVINNDTQRNNDYEALMTDEYPGDDQIAFSLENRSSRWPLIRIGFLIMFAPLLMALYYGVSYADPGAEVILWFSFLTVPLGLLIILSTALTRLFVRYFWRVNRR